MASPATTAGYQNLPAQTITTTTETALLVPAQGLYAGLPSPTLAAGAGLTIGFAPDIVGSIYDGHPFIVSLVGKATTGGAITFLPKIYQVPASIIAAGTQATVANDHVTVALAATSISTATQNFIVEAQFLWDSTSKILNGQVIGAQINGVNIAANSGTAGTMVATTQITAVGIGDLNFMPSFTFGTANAGNIVTVTEFVIDRA
jgi:hypothetical protein